MKIPGTAARKARDVRGWTAEATLGFIYYAKDYRIGQGTLVNWLQGVTKLYDIPIGPDEAERRYHDRAEAERAAEQEDQRRAETIRGETWGRAGEARATGKDVSDWCVHAAVFRKLKAEGLERFANETERDGAAEFARRKRENCDGPRPSDTSTALPDSTTDELTGDIESIRPDIQPPPSPWEGANSRDTLERKLVEMAKGG